jgi:hypothetical protein
MFRKKQKHLSGKEIILTEEQKKEVQRKREIARNRLYPFLLDNSKSIQDAQVFCQSVSIAINQAFTNKKKEFKVKEFGLIEQLDKNNSEFKRYKEILEMFEDENLSDALEIIEGMNNAIDGFIREENTKRSLETLKTEFL